MSREEERLVERIRHDDRRDGDHYGDRRNVRREKETKARDARRTR